MKRLYSLYFALLTILSSFIQINGMDDPCKSQEKIIYWRKLENKTRARSSHDDSYIKYTTDDLGKLNLVKDVSSDDTIVQGYIDGYKIEFINYGNKKPYSSFEYDMSAPEGLAGDGPMGWYANALLQLPNKSIAFLAHTMAFNAQQDYEQKMGETGLYLCKNADDITHFIALFDHLVRKNNGYPKLLPGDRMYRHSAQYIFQGDGNSLYFDKEREVLEVKDIQGATIYEYFDDLNKEK